MTVSIAPEVKERGSWGREREIEGEKRRSQRNSDRRGIVGVTYNVVDEIKTKCLNKPPVFVV